MGDFLFILKFIGGILLVFGAGGFISHLLRLDQYVEEQENHLNEKIKEANKKDEINKK